MKKMRNSVEGERYGFLEGVTAESWKMCDK